MRDVSIVVVVFCVVVTIVAVVIVGSALGGADGVGVGGCGVVDLNCIVERRRMILGDAVNVGNTLALFNSRFMNLRFLAKRSRSSNILFF